MNYLESYRLQGTEMVTMFFDPNEAAVMYMVLGENVDGKKDDVTYLYLYKFLDGEVDCGIDTYVFRRGDNVDDFVERLPQMSAVELLTAGLGVRPKMYEVE